MLSAPLGVVGVVLTNLPFMQFVFVFAFVHFGQRVSVQVVIRSSLGLKWDRGKGM